jgi:gamma-D-glutamyl-L-lysine dipeptidyl-peptidase
MRIIFALALGSQAVAVLPSTLSRRDTAPQQIGYISVSVATVWTNSGKPRPVDGPALTNPADVEGWLDSMTLDQYLDLTDSDRTQTQALYGTRVSILSQQDGWYEVAVDGQPTPKNSLGYPGWVPAAQVSLDSSYGQLLSNKPFAAVDKAAIAPLYRDVLMTEIYLEISYDTRLPVIGHLGELIQVAVPSGGSAYLSARDATVYDSVSSIPYPSGKDIVSAGKLFLGRPYLWGGTSGFAFDCSGFTHTLYDARGITIARDSDAQADFTGHGTQVAQSDLQAGDLIFYASNLTNPSTIHHVAVYAGDGEMLEAYGAGIPVRITPVRFNDEYWGAERFLAY